MIGQAPGVFVLEPERAGMEPRAVVRAIGPDEGRNGRRAAGVVLATLDIEHSCSPALFHVLEEVQRVARMVREEAVELAVGVDVNKPQTRVSSFFIPGNDACRS